MPAPVTDDHPATAIDPELAAEQAYLSRARAELDRMRRHALSLDVGAADPVTAAYLARSLYRRAQALVDDVSTTLFFGRTDHADGERWYVGRRHVADAEGDPVVVDWRAEVARSFYRASRTAPMGVVRRRRFGVDAGWLTAYEDETLVAASGPALADASGGPATLRSAIVAREVERPRIGPMRDIVATIQPEQDEIVRAELAQSVCVQGAPGTGKTAVGLHRAAWLLYAHRDRLSRTGVLVVGPNASFLEHVSAVLPSLGEVEVRHTTVDALVGASALPAARRGLDPVDVAVLKGDARLAEVLRRAVWSHLRRPSGPLVVPRGTVRWRVPAYRVAEILDELAARGVRYAAARDMLPQRLAHAVLVLMEDAGGSPDDRVQDAVARGRDVRRYVDDVWPALDPKAVLLRLLTDREFLAACADGVLDAGEQERLRWPEVPRSAGRARWSPADCVLLDELADLLRRTTSLGHVVLDEAQDLSPMQLRAVGRRCSTGSVTVLGDIAQGTTPWATPSWAESLAHLGRPDATLEVLDRGFRVPAAVIDYAARLLPRIAPGLGAPISVREDPGTLEIVSADSPGAAVDRVVAEVRSALVREGSVGAIVPDADVPAVARALGAAGVAHTVLGGGHGLDDATAEALLDAALGDGDAGPPARVSVVPATVAKGLEYDHVVVLDPASIADAEPDERTGLRRLYVVLTRAVSGLAIVHHRPLPQALDSPARPST